MIDESGPAGAGKESPMVRLLDGRPFDPAPARRSERTRADREAVRRIALGLPGVRQEDHRFAFYVERAGRRRPIAWEWIAPGRRGGPRVPQSGVLVLRTATVEERERMVEQEPEKFSADLHYSDYPAVLVHLDQIDETELARLITAAWRTQALIRRAPRPARLRPRATSQPVLPLSA